MSSIKKHITFLGEKLFIPLLFFCATCKTQNNSSLLSNIKNPVIFEGNSNIGYSDPAIDSELLISRRS